jgi:membrane fusion protein, macrolide-specific efflux system
VSAPGDRRSWRRSILPCSLGLAAAATGYVAVSQLGPPASSARTETELVAAADGVVQTTVSGTGDVEAGTDDDVNFATSGTLDQVYVHEGEYVTKGQILATLDPDAAQLRLDQANATLTAAKDTLAEAEDSSASSSDATAIDDDELTVKSDEQTVGNDQLTLSETTLRAPTSGTIASLEDLWPGDPVAAGSSSSGSSSSTASSGASSSAASTSSSTTPSTDSSSDTSSSSSFAEIVNTKTLTMTVAVSEADIGEIKVGQPATVTMDALTGVELAARVASISQTATDSDDVVSYDVTLDLDQTDPRVLSGMSASAVLIVHQAQGVTVPNDALTGSGSESTLTLDEGGKRVERQVLVGLRGTSRSVIASGLQPGDELVVDQTLPSLGSGTSSASSGSSGVLGGSSGLSGASTGAGPPGAGGAP